MFQQNRDYSHYIYIQCSFENVFMNEYEFEKKIQFPSFMTWNYLLYPPAVLKIIK